MMERQDYPNRALPFFPPQSTTSEDEGFFGLGPQTTSSSIEYEAVTIEPTENTYTYGFVQTTTSEFFFGFPTPSATASSSTAELSSTFATSTYTSETASSSQHTKAGESQSSSSPLPIVQHGHDNGGLSSGKLAAAIVPPVVVALLLGLFLGALLWRRKRRAVEGDNARNRAGSAGSGAFFLPAGIKEKWGSIRSGSSLSDTRPEVTNATNNAYFTGLDTSSRGSHSQDDPPPYVQRPSTAAVRDALPVIDRNVPGFQVDFSEIERFPTPPTTNQAQQPSRLGAMLDAPVGDARSARTLSFSSTLYSDTASVHSARAARRSFGGQLVQPAFIDNGSRSSSPEEGPFGDEANSPVSPLSSASGRS